MTNKTSTTFSLLLFTLALGCIVLPPSGGDGGTDDGTPTELCAFHAWTEAAVSVFPANPPLNELGGVLVSPPAFQCVTSAGGTIDLTGVTFPVPVKERTGLSNSQADAEAMWRIYNDIPEANDQLAADDPANEARARSVVYCTDLLLDEGCSEDDVGINWGADSVCKAWLGNNVYRHIRVDLDFAPAASEGKETSGGCDFEDLPPPPEADSTGGSDGGVDIDVTCTGLICEYDPAMHGSVFADFDMMYRDGVKATWASSAALGVVLGIPSNTESADIFRAFQLFDGDKITKLNGINVNVSNLNALIAALENSTTFTYTLRRGMTTYNRTVRPY